MKFMVNGLVLACAFMLSPLIYAQTPSADTPLDNDMDIIEAEVATDLDVKIAEMQSEIDEAETDTDIVEINLQPDKVVDENQAINQLSTHDEQQLFTVASGYANGVYYMFGTLISGLASHPEGSLSCDKGGTCGADNITMINLSSEGSLANLQALREGRVDSGFAQSNIAYWAYTASGLYDKQEPQQNLRAIASFYPEMMHLVVRKDSGIARLSDLSGKRVSLGTADSGTLTNVRQVLRAFDIDEGSFDSKLIDLRETTERFESGELDAFFFVGGLPTPMITHVADTQEIKLIPITSSHSDAFLSNNKYYTSQVIPAGTYPGVENDVETFAVAALWLTNDTADEALIYDITKAIWTLENRPYWMEKLLPINGLNINHALDGIGIPLHNGAKRYYNEIGKRF